MAGWTLQQEHLPAMSDALLIQQRVATGDFSAPWAPGVLQQPFDSLFSPSTLQGAAVESWAHPLVPARSQGLGTGVHAWTKHPEETRWYLYIYIFLNTRFSLLCLHHGEELLHGYSSCPAAAGPAHSSQAHGTSPCREQRRGRAQLCSVFTAWEQEGSGSMAGTEGRTWHLTLPKRSCHGKGHISSWSPGRGEAILREAGRWGQPLYSPTEAAPHAGKNTFSPFLTPFFLFSGVSWCLPPEGSR